MTFYGLKTCDTCRKADKALRAAGFTPVVVDVRADGVPEAVLAGLLEQFGDALINRRSTTWRTLDEAARSGDSLKLLRDHPTLMKRPVIVDGDKTYLGWDKTVQSTLLPAE